MKQGEVIKWKNSKELLENEELSPTFEDLILANVLRKIHIRLPRLVRAKYHPLIRGRKSLMDFKDDIFVMVSTFLMKIKDNLLLASKINGDLLERYVNF